MTDWSKHVHRFAKKHKMTYKQANVSKKCKETYKKRKTSPRRKKKSPRKRRMNIPPSWDGTVTLHDTLKFEKEIEGTRDPEKLAELQTQRILASGSSALGSHYWNRPGWRPKGSSRNNPSPGEEEAAMMREINDLSFGPEAENPETAAWRASRGAFEEGYGY